MLNLQLFLASLGRDLGSHSVTYNDGVLESAKRTLYPGQIHVSGECSVLVIQPMGSLYVTCVNQLGAFSFTVRKLLVIDERLRSFTIANVGKEPVDFWLTFNMGCTDACR